MRSSAAGGGGRCHGRRGSRPCRSSGRVGPDVA